MILPPQRWPETRAPDSGCEAPRRRAIRAIGATLALVCLAACDSAIDAQRATICRRALPALAPAGVVVTVLRIGAGPSPDSLRADYGVSGRAGEAARQRWAVCGFGPGAELLAVTTERGPLSGAALYLLKRYYLETPDAEAADPAAKRE